MTWIACNSLMEKDAGSCDVSAQQPKPIEEHIIDAVMEETKVQKGNFNDQVQDEQISVEVGGEEKETPKGVDSNPMEPAIGMEFDTKEEAKSYYNAYAYRKGFGIKTGSTRRSNITKEFNRIEFACCSERNSGTTSTSKRSNTIIKTGCKARMVIGLRGQKWEVRQIELQHNHTLLPSPTKMRFFRSHRKIFKDEYGLKKDVSNLRTATRHQHNYIDMAETVQYFQQLQVDNAAFFYSMQLDDNNTVRSLFWVDGASRVAYHAFGECIIFDTTYCIDMYKMPFAPIIGISNHTHPILFGCTLLKDESAETFTWLFKTFLRAMEGKPPVIIMTDQDGSMEQAIATVFPNTVHRRCMWHVQKNIKLKLDALLSKRAGFQNDFSSCIDDSLTLEDFERDWVAMIERHGLQRNTYLQHLWDIRQKWVPCYFNENFFPFMSTTQRSAGMNSLFKDFVHPQESIRNFVTQYEKLVQTCWDRDDNQHFITLQTTPNFWSEYPIERQAAQCYTRKIFEKFQEQLKNTTCYNINEIVPGKTYGIVNNNSSTAQNRTYVVTVNLMEQKFNCVCKKFERDGLLCGHILKVMTQFNINSMTERYVLKRWTLHASDHALHDVQNLSAGIDQYSTRTLKFNTLCRKMVFLASEACKTEDGYHFTSHSIDDLISQVSGINLTPKHGMHHTGFNSKGKQG